MKEKKTFEYTEENYIDKVPSSVFKHLGGYGLGRHGSGNVDFDKFTNGIGNCNGFRPMIDGLKGYSDPFIGKTIDFHYFDENNDFWFMGFTDGTFTLRVREDINMEYSTAYYHEPCMVWLDSYWLTPCICVAYNETLWMRETDSPKITPIGKWLEEHTDIDIIGYYTALKESFDNSIIEQRERQKKEDLKKYNELKEKLGL